MVKLNLLWFWSAHSSEICIEISVVNVSLAIRTCVRFPFLSLAHSLSLVLSFSRSLTFSLPLALYLYLSLFYRLSLYLPCNNKQIFTFLIIVSKMMSIYYNQVDSSIKIQTACELIARISFMASLFI